MKILFLGLFSFILNFVFGQCPDAGIDTDTTICPSSAPLDLLTLVNGNPDQGGYWYYHNDEQAVTSKDMKYEACSHGQGLFTYIVSKEGCPDDSSNLFVHWSWNPCQWLYQLATCKWVPEADPNDYMDDVWLITLPAFPGPEGIEDYEINSTIADIRPQSGSFYESTTFTIQFKPALNNYDTVFTISFHECHQLSCLFDFIIYDMVEYCACKPPPNAGENTNLFIKADSDPFDLRMCLNGNPDPNGTWSPPLKSGTNIYDPKLDGGGEFTYSVNTYKCPGDTAKATIVIVLDHFFIPSIFTPNKDGINDILVVSADKSVNIIESFEIFSRWGEMVYSVKNFVPNEPQTGWDGTHDNKNLSTGVFAYKLVSTDKTGNKTITRGDITLIR